MARAAAKRTGPRPVDLIEDSVHLLRRYPQELGVYYGTSGPFAIALLYFWSYVAWFVPADGMVAAGALVLALTFGLMKAGQNRFALRMQARRIGEEPGPWTARDWLRETASQLRLQATGIVLVPLAAVFGVPFAWVYSYTRMRRCCRGCRGTERPNPGINRRGPWPCFGRSRTTGRS